MNEPLQTFADLFAQWDDLDESLSEIEDEWIPINKEISRSGLGRTAAETLGGHDEARLVENGDPGGGLKGLVGVDAGDGDCVQMAAVDPVSDEA